MSGKAKAPKKRTSQAEKALEIVGGNIRLAEARITALHFSLEKLRQSDKIRGKAGEEFSALHALLFADLNECYRAFFMWSGLIGGAAQIEANKKAFKHYLDRKMAIMGYLGFDGEYRVVDEELFREELFELEKKSTS